MNAAPAELPRLFPVAALFKLDSDGSLPGSTREDTVALLSIAKWAHEYLTNSHPDLGRSGQVCPWVQPSMRAGNFYLGVIRDAGADLARVEQIFAALLTHYLNMNPQGGREAQLKTIVTVFPDLSEEDAPGVMPTLHERLKPMFLKQGLMLGEFYATCPKEGLRNPSFRPLRSPLPLLVIRAMVETDIAFLSNETRFAQAYLEKFRSAGCDQALAFLDSHRERLNPTQVAAVLSAIQQLGGATDLLRIRERDSLTGLYTVGFLLERIETAISSRSAFGCSVVVLGLDVDDGGIEKQYGQGCAAFVMWELARRVKELVRSENVVVRHSRSAFGVMLTSGDDVKVVAERIRTIATLHPLAFNGSTFKLPIRVGYASLDGEITFATGLQFLARAERAWKSAQATRADVAISA
jgi:diguanylate cyclase (GGDEF)-like protein